MVNSTHGRVSVQTLDNFEPTATIRLTCDAETSVLIAAILVISSRSTSSGIRAVTVCPAVNHVVGLISEVSHLMKTFAIANAIKQGQICM
jgi:hypothetical protein